MHIRINKRIFERTVFGIVIIALLAIVLIKPDAPEITDTGADVTGMQIRIDDLQAENEKLQEELAEAERQTEIVKQAAEERQEAVGQQQVQQQQAAPNPQPEPEVEGDVEISWSVESLDGKLNDITIEIQNGKSSTQEVLYRIYWEGLSDKSFIEGVKVIKSKDRHTENILLEGEFKTSQSIPRNPGEHIKTLVFRVMDTDEKLIDQLSTVVQ